MVVLNVPVNNCTPQTIVIGRRGTYDTMQIAFDLSYLVESYGNGVAVLAVKRSQDESAYPAVTSQEDDLLLWTISETDTYYVGSGECQLMWYVDGGLAKTIIYPMVVMRDILATSEETPDAYQEWVDALIAEGAETLQNAQDAAQSATDAEAAQTAAETAADRAEDALEEFTTPTASATSLAPEAQATAAYSSGHFTFGIPRGAQGATGATPDFEIGTVETLEPDQPATATITGTPENPVLNLGIPKGEKGEGSGGGAVESVNGKTGVVVLTASDVGAGTYSKPSGGIPKTDLAAAVQTSLGKADTALQAAPVSSVAGKTGAVQLNAGDIEFADSETYAAGSIGAEVSQQKNAISQLEDQVVTDVTVTGTDVTIVAQANKRYLCGTVSTIAVTPCATGAFDLIFTSGSSAAILTIPSTVKWQDSSFDPTALDTDTIYEISVADGTLGLVASWT